MIPGSAGRLTVALAVVVVCACSRNRPPVEATNQSPSAPLHQGPLTDYVPSAGLRWMFTGRPKDLANHPQFLAHAVRIVSKNRLDAFAGSSGVRLLELSEGCIAGFDYGTLYLARVGAGTQAVRKAFEVRLVSEPVVRSSRSGLSRMTGLVANTPESLLTVDDDFVAVAVGDPLLSRIVEGFAVSRLKKSRPALQGAALGSLPGDLEQAPLRFYAPGPFANEWANAAGGVLARVFAVGAAMTLPNASQLHIRLVLSGAFGPDLDETRSRLMTTWARIQTSSVGHLLQLHLPSEPATFLVDSNTATVDVKFPIDSLMQGLSAAVIDDVTQLMGLDTTKTSATPNEH
jgi:hypothetical protein